MRGRIPELFSTLMTPYLNNLDEVVLPGLISVNWIALNICSFVESIHKAVAEVDLLIDRVLGVQQNRVDLALQEILEVELCALPPSDEVMSIEEFVQGTKVQKHSITELTRLALSNVLFSYRSPHNYSQNVYVIDCNGL